MVLKLSEAPPGYWNFRFCWHPGSVRLILEVREPSWRIYLPTVLWHARNIEFLRLTGKSVKMAASN
jgi:hypothetical protein